MSSIACYAANRAILNDLGYGLDGACRVMPDRHRRIHAQEAELAVEALGPRVGVQDDLLVLIREGHKLPDDRLAEPASLVVRVDSHIGDIGAVEAISQYTSGTGEDATGIDEAHEHAVAEHRRQRRRRLVTERGDPIQAGKFLQVHSIKVVDLCVVIHRALLTLSPVPATLRMRAAPAARQPVSAPSLIRPAQTMVRRDLKPRSRVGRLCRCGRAGISSISAGDGLAGGASSASQRVNWAGAPGREGRQAAAVLWVIAIRRLRGGG